MNPAHFLMVPRKQIFSAKKENEETNENLRVPNSENMADTLWPTTSISSIFPKLSLQLVA